MFVSGRGIVRYRTVDGWNPAPPAIYETLWKNGIFSKSQQVSLPDFWLPSTPIGSMYGINFRWFLLVNVVMDPMGILWISSPPISTFSGYTLLSWHLGFGCWGFGWFLALEGSDRFGNCEQRPNRTFVENPKHQDYTWKCTIYIQYIWYSNLMCVCAYDWNIWIDYCYIMHAYEYLQLYVMFSM